MMKKLTSPYKFAPAMISTARIDDLLAQGAVAGINGSGQRGLKSVDLVTFTVNGQIVDQFSVSGHTAATTKFVVAFNAKVREMQG